MNTYTGRLRTSLRQQGWGTDTSIAVEQAERWNLIAGFLMASLLVLVGVWMLGSVALMRAPAGSAVQTPALPNVTYVEPVAAPATEAGEFQWAYESDVHNGEVPGWTTKPQGQQLDYGELGGEGARNTTGIIFER